MLARAERDRMASTAEQKRLQLVKKELAWLRRGPPARTSKPQFRIDAANALIADEPPARDDIALQRFATARLGKQVYDVEHVSLAYGDTVLYDDVTWRVGPGDRVGIVGVNGAGKSTLLKMLVGQVPPDAGQVKVGQTVKPAYLSQEVAELDPSLRVLEAVEQVARSVDLGGKPVGASSLCDRFGFTGNAQWTRVGDLSGGERRRLQVLRLLMGEPNVLLLDEPTNDLDIDTLNALEDVLDGWPGTLLVVSHDRYFLERVTTVTSSLMGDGTVAALPGGVEEYLAKRVRRGAPAPAKPPAGPRTDPRAAKKELSRVEREIGRLDKAEAKLHAQLAEQAADHAAVLALDGELRDLQAQKAALEDAWLELSEQVLAAGPAAAPVVVERAVGLHEPHDRQHEQQEAGDHPAAGRRADGGRLAAAGVQVADLAAADERRGEPDEHRQQQGDTAAEAGAAVALHLLVGDEVPVPAVDAEGDEEQQDPEAGAADLADRDGAAVRGHPAVPGLAVRGLAVRGGAAVRGRVRVGGGHATPPSGPAAGPPGGADATHAAAPRQAIGHAHPERVRGRQGIMEGLELLPPGGAPHPSRVV